eukprot:SAG11_NODE_2331_length_3508_cov_1.993838_3_plen_140_part_00
MSGAAAQAFFSRGYEMLVEPSSCRIIGAKAWAHSSPADSEDPWGSWSNLSDAGETATAIDPPRSAWARARLLRLRRHRRRAAAAGPGLWHRKWRPLRPARNAQMLVRPGSCRTSSRSRTSCPTPPRPNTANRTLPGSTA